MASIQIMFDKYLYSIVLELENCIDNDDSKSNKDDGKMIITMIIIIYHKMKIVVIFSCYHSTQYSNLL